MMNAEKEIRIAKELRRLARAYGDGEFNKGEYRRRRRVLLMQCIEESPPLSQPDPGAPKEAKEPQTAQYPSWVRAVMIPFLMGAGVVIALCLLGYFIYTLL